MSSRAPHLASSEDLAHEAPPAPQRSFRDHRQPARERPSTALDSASWWGSDERVGGRRQKEFLGPACALTAVRLRDAELLRGAPPARRMAVASDDEQVRGASVGDACSAAAHALRRTPEPTSSGIAHASSGMRHCARRMRAMYIDERGWNTAGSDRVVDDRHRSRGTPEALVDLVPHHAQMQITRLPSRGSRSRPAPAASMKRWYGLPPIRAVEGGRVARRSSDPHRARRRPRGDVAASRCSLDATLAPACRGIAASTACTRRGTEVSLRRAARISATASTDRRSAGVTRAAASARQ